MRKILNFLGSIGFTIILLLLLIFLVIVGTLEQTKIGLYRAQQEYFHSIISFFPSSGMLKIPFPGGALLFTLLFANLLASFIVKFKFRWNQVGLWCCHIGLLILILGSFITFLLSESGNISLTEQKPESEFYDLHNIELLLVETTSPKFDQVAIFSQNNLVKNAILTASKFPLTIKVLEYYESCFAIPSKESPSPTFSKYQFRLHAMKNRDPGCTLQVFANGQDLGNVATLLDTPIIFSFQFPEGERKFKLLLRRQLFTLPFQITLQQFQVEFYPGTQTPRSFESQVSIQDNEIKHDAMIRMNRPLRYRGYTFYQSSYQSNKQEYTSVLAVVHNPGELLPYFSCILIALGLVIHFAVKIIHFLKQNSQENNLT